MKRRELILLLGGASSGAMSVGTGAFSSVEAERNVEVDVVEDENAYLGLTRKDAAGSVPLAGNSGTDVVRIQNQFASPLDLSVVIKDKDEAIDYISIDDQAVEIIEECEDREQHESGDEEIEECEDNEDVLCPGGSAAVSVNCDEVGKASFTLQFCGNTSGATVNKTRAFEIECVDPIEGVQFAGSNGNGEGSGNSGNVKIRTQSRNSNRIISATAYYRDSDRDIETEQKHVSVNKPLKPSDFGITNGPIVGIGVKGIKGVYKRPDNPGNGNFVDTLTQDPSWD